MRICLVVGSVALRTSLMGWGYDICGEILGVIWRLWCLPSIRMAGLLDPKRRRFQSLFLYVFNK